MENEKSVIEPCPYCGGEARFNQGPTRGGFVACGALECMAIGPSALTEAEAVARWSAVAQKCRAFEPLKAVYGALDSCVDLTPEVMIRARAALAGGGE